MDQALDTTRYVGRTLSRRARRQRASRMAQGIWRSDMAGLVGEAVYIAHTYATNTGLNAHLEEVVRYIQLVKREPGLEVMALEVDQR